MTTHLVIPDSHAHPDYHNDRADYLAQLILDVKPDVVIHMGDSADMASLSTYDKGKRSFAGRSYRKDIDSHLQFQDRMWGPVLRRKRRLPRSYFLIGNHEQRIEKALDLSPELTGTIGLDDLRLGDWYDHVVPYSGLTPGSIIIDGVKYAHYHVAGILGKPTGGIHPAHTLVSKFHGSCTAAHSHLADWYTTSPNGRPIMGLLAGCYQDYDAPWAGETNKLWWRGVVVKRGVADGAYDPQFISLEQLRKEYGP